MAANVSFHRGGRWVFPGIVFLIAGVLILEASRVWLADIRAASAAPEDWERAAQLEPGNAGHWTRLGKFRQWDFEHADLARAVRYFERAVEANPSSPFARLDLADAYEMQGDAERAERTFEEAKRLYPISSEVAWKYGNFLLRSGQTEEAYAEIHRALGEDSSLVPLAVSVCWRAGAGPDRIVSEILPARAAGYLDAIHFFVAEGEVEAALRVWAHLVALGEPFELKRSSPLLETLLQQRRTADAKRVWEEALAAAQGQPDGRVPNSLVWDGGFEQGFLNFGFGWRVQRVAGARLAIDGSVFHAGARSLRITFDGTANLDFQLPRQFVVVEAGKRYRLTAVVRLDDVTTDSGVRFRIFDVERPSLQVFTDNLVGTLPWTLQRVDFIAGPETRLVGIAVRRIPSIKLDNKIAGTVWVDEVSFTPVLAASGLPGP